MQPHMMCSIAYTGDEHFAPKIGGQFEFDEIEAWR